MSGHWLCTMITHLCTVFVPQVVMNSFLAGAWGAEEFLRLETVNLRRGQPVRLWVRLAPDAFELYVPNNQQPVYRRVEGWRGAFLLHFSPLL